MERLNKNRRFLLMLEQHCSDVSVRYFAYLCRTYGVYCPFSISAKLRKFIATQIGTSDRILQKALKQLVEFGFLLELGKNAYKINPSINIYK